MDEFQKKIDENKKRFVPKFYKMDPETEDLLASGRELENGMKVLLDSSALRMKVDVLELSDWQEDRALENNRWCTVGALEIDLNHGSIRFIGVYEDGSKRMRVNTIDQSWLVKKDSIRNLENLITERYEKIRSFVLEAMMAQDWATLAGNSDETMMQIAGAATDKILGEL